MTEPLAQVYERLRAELGREHSHALGVIDGRNMRRFAVASNAPGDWTETDEDDDAQVAPPLYLSSVMGWGSGPAESELRADGSGLDDTRGLPLEGVRLMGAGQELEFHEPVRAGMSVVEHTSLADVQLKAGRSGPLLIMNVRRRFTDESGRALVTCRESFIGR